MGSSPVLQPGPDHPITITGTPGVVRVMLGDQLIAQTSRALTLQEASYPAVQYIPLADVDQDLLAPSTHHTHCPYKGEAGYFSIVGAAAELINAVWIYREPHPAVAAIKDHVAFYPDRVQIRATS